MFDNQRVSILDPKTGKTKRKVSKISALFKNVISMNLSDSSMYDNIINLVSMKLKCLFDFRVVSCWCIKQW